MKVITLNDKSFSLLCRRLAERVDASGYRYEAVVGIATGGVYVADKIGAPVTFSVSRHRVGTEAKRGVIGEILRRLPAAVNTRLRVIESRLLGIKDVLQPPKVEAMEIEGPLREWLREAPRRVLIVDDAIDSGATISAVKRGIEEVAAAGTEVRTAVITVTRRHPIVEPDYTLFDDRVLIRFPWSADVRGKE